MNSIKEHALHRCPLCNSDKHGKYGFRETYVQVQRAEPVMIKCHWVCFHCHHSGYRLYVNEQLAADMSYSDLD